MSNRCTRCGNPNDIFQYCPCGEGGEPCIGVPSENNKPISQMTREEVRAELEKEGLLKSTEWFNTRILPMLLEDTQLRKTLNNAKAEIERLESELSCSKDTVLAADNVIMSLQARIEKLERLLQIDSNKRYSL